MKEIDPLALRGVKWMGKGALLCLGLLAMVTLVIVMGVLTAVMVTTIALPTTAVRRRGWRESTNTTEVSASRKAVAS